MPVFVQIKHTRYNTLISELETCSSGRFCYLQTEQARFFSPRRDPGEKTGLMFRMTLMLSYANKFTVQTRDWCRSARLTLGNETNECLSVFLWTCDWNNPLPQLQLSGPNFSTCLSLPRSVDCDSLQRETTQNKPFTKLSLTRLNTLQSWFNDMS